MIERPSGMARGMHYYEPKVDQEWTRIHLHAAPRVMGNPTTDDAVFEDPRNRS